VEKADLSKGYHQNPKRKWGITMHFSEIIELKFGKKFPYILCILKLFCHYGCLIIYEKCVLPIFFFFSNYQLPLDLLFPHRHNHCQNIFVLGGTVLKSHRKVNSNIDQDNFELFVGT